MKGISLFSSGGIGDLALSACGIDIILANEIVRERAELLAYNNKSTHVAIGNIWEHKKYIVNKTRELLNGSQLDFILATPPCQGMSKNGKGKLLNGVRSGKRDAYDSRNRLIIPTIEIIAELLPNIVILENVPEMQHTNILHNGTPINIFDFINNSLAPLGYIGAPEVVEFANYGIPQKRQRLIAIYTRHQKLISVFEDKKTLLPPPTHDKHGSNGLLSWRTLRDAISHLPKLDGRTSKTACSDIPYHRVPVLAHDKYYWISNTPKEQGAFDNPCISCGHNETQHGNQKDESGINRSSKNTPIYCSKCNSLLPRPWVG